MSIRKCPKCRLVAWDGNTSCRRCEADLATAVGEMPAIHQSPSAGLPTFVRPSLFKIIRTDYVSSLALIAPIVAIGLYIAIGIFNLNVPRSAQGMATGDGWHKVEKPPRGDNSGYLVLAIATATVCFPLLMLRLIAIEQAFVRGLEVPATIISSRFFRGRARIEYTYSFKGRMYNCATDVQKKTVVYHFLAHDVTTVIVDPRKPHKGVLRDLFTG